MEFRSADVNMRMMNMCQGKCVCTKAQIKKAELEDILGRIEEHKLGSPVDECAIEFYLNIFEEYMDDLEMNAVKLSDNVYEYPTDKSRLYITNHRGKTTIQLWN